MSLTTAPADASLAPSFAGVFPLPLTPMEEFMIADARDDYAMMCDTELAFEGTIDREAFEAALPLALARNPLLVSLVSRDAAGNHVWVPADRLPTVDWAPLGTPIGGDYGRTLDLAHDMGLRIWVRPGQDESIVMFQFHHACTDGVGFLAFCEDLLAAYAAVHPEGPRVALRPLNPQRLIGRGAGNSAAQPLATSLRHPDGHSRGAAVRAPGSLGSRLRSSRSALPATSSFGRTRLRTTRSSSSAAWRDRPRPRSTTCCCAI